jgi:hypothetical protein
MYTQVDIHVRTHVYVHKNTHTHKIGEGTSDWAVGGGAVGSGTALQTGRSQVRFPME